MSNFVTTVRNAGPHGHIQLNNNEEIQVVETEKRGPTKKTKLDEKTIETNNKTRKTFYQGLCAALTCPIHTKEKLQALLITKTGKPLTLKTAQKAVKLATRSKVKDMALNFTSYKSGRRMLRGYKLRSFFLGEKKAFEYASKLGKAEGQQMSEEGTKVAVWKEKPKVDPLTVDVSGLKIPRREELAEHKNIMIDHALQNFKNVPDKSLTDNPAEMRVEGNQPGMSVEIDQIVKGGGESRSLEVALNLPKAFWSGQPVMPNKVMRDFLKLSSHKFTAAEFGHEIPKIKAGAISREEHAEKIKEFLGENLTQEQLQDLKERINFMKQTVDLCLVKIGEPKKEASDEELLEDPNNKKEAQLSEKDPFDVRGAMINRLSTLQYLGLSDEGPSHLLGNDLLPSMNRVKNAVTGLCLNYELIFGK